MTLSSSLLCVACAFGAIGWFRHWVHWEHGGLSAVIVIGCLMGSCTAKFGPALGW